MATTGVVNATDIKLFVGGKKVAEVTSATLGVTHEPRNTTSKDSDGWRSLAEGLRTWEMSGNALFSFESETGFSTLFEAYDNRDAITVLFSTEVTGDIEYSGTAQITSLSQTGGFEDNQTFEFTFQGTSEIKSDEILEPEEE